MSKEPIILPEKYYLDYFNYLLDFVSKHYPHILEAPEYLFIQSFRNLTEGAQCLYLRLSNRRGSFFRVNKIDYAEITDLPSSKEELVVNEFIVINESPDLAQLNLFSKAELLEEFEFLKKSSRKEALLMELTEEDVLTLHENEEIMEVKKNDEVDFLKLLFFGNRYTQMTEFVIRDIGNIKVRPLDESKFKPWFQNRDEAVSVMHIHQLKKMIREMEILEMPVDSILNEMPWVEWLKYPRSKAVADKLLIEIAVSLERNGNLEKALKYYQLTSLPPSRERQVRILDKKGGKEQAVGLAKEIIEEPNNATELTFARDFLDRSGIRINRSMTRRLMNAKVISLPKEQIRVEKQVLNYFSAMNWQGVHAENTIWRSLFGIIFWNELFDENHGSFHHPLQRQPSDLHDPNFFEIRKESLQNQINRFKTRKKLIHHLQVTFRENYGIANRFVTWHEQLIPLLEVMVQLLPLKGLKQVVLEIAKQTKENSTGFPDLFLWNDNTYQFYEIKSPNDHLSAQQLFWLDYLSSVGINADILKINYTTNT